MKAEYKKLYKKEDRHVMKLAEDSLNPKIDRLESLTTTLLVKDRKLKHHTIEKLKKLKNGKH